MSNPKIDSVKPQKVAVQDFYSVQEAAALLCISKTRIYELAKRADDPFPLRRLKGFKRTSIVLRKELIAWVQRNYVLASDR